MLNHYIIIIMSSPLTVFLCFCVLSLLGLNLLFPKLLPHTEGGERTWGVNNLSHFHVKYIHISCDPRTFFLWQNRNSVHIQQQFPLSPSPFPGNSILFSPMCLTTLTTSFQWNHPMFVLSCQPYFTLYNVH